MVSSIIIEIDDGHQLFCVVWPDKTAHSYRLSPPQTEHSIKNRIADEINRMMVVPELCSTKPAVGAGVLQCENEALIRVFMTNTKAYLTHDGGSFVLKAYNGTHIAYGDTIHNITINAGLRK